MSLRSLLIGIIAALFLLLPVGLSLAQAGAETNDLEPLERRVAQLEKDVESLKHQANSDSLEAELSTLKRELTSYQAGAAERSFNATLQVLSANSKKTEQLFAITGMGVAIAAVIVALFGMKAVSQTVETLVRRRVNILLEKKMKDEIDTRLEGEIARWAKHHQDISQHLDETIAMFNHEHQELRASWDVWHDETDQKFGELLQDLKQAKALAAGDQA